jgi:PIN domain nuclease of toxin-antitoxin system
VRLLLDTHAALWWLDDDKRLPASARRVLAKAEHDQFLSVAAAWEMAIKSSLGNLKLPVPVGRFIQEHLPANRIELLPVGFGDLARIEKMPFHHRDPFDRMMAAQALERQLTIVSGDPLFEKYGVKRVW